MEREIASGTETRICVLKKIMIHVKALIEVCHNKKKRVWESDLIWLEMAANPPMHAFVLYD